MSPLIARVYKKAFWNIYDNIGKLILLNLVWAALFPIPAFLAFAFLPLTGQPRIAAALLVGLFTHSFATTGIFAATADIVDYKGTSLKKFFRAGAALYPRALVINLLLAAFYYFLYVSIRFYLALEGAAGIFGFFLVGLQVWIGAFVLVMRVYIMPLLVKKRWGVWKTIKWSAVLVVIRPGFSILIFLQAAAMAIILGITIIGAVVVVMGLASVFLNTALREVLKELEESEEPRKKPTSWKEIFEEERRREEEPRTFKDILKPWEH
jgi:uncharacterized membrane protein YesL